MCWVWGMRKIIMQQPDYVLLQATLKITLHFCFKSLYPVPNRQLSFQGSGLQKAGATGSWFVGNREFGIAGNPRCSPCGLRAESLPASASTPPMAPGRRAREGGCQTARGTLNCFCNTSGASAPEAAGGPAWSHLEAWQIQLLAGSWPTSPPLRVSWCYCENDFGLCSWKVTLPLCRSCCFVPCTHLQGRVEAWYKLTLSKKSTEVNFKSRTTSKAPKNRHREGSWTSQSSPPIRFMEKTWRFMQQQLEKAEKEYTDKAQMSETQSHFSVQASKCCLFSFFFSFKKKIKNSIPNLQVTCGNEIQESFVL